MAGERGSRLNKKQMNLSTSREVIKKITAHSNIPKPKVNLNQRISKINALQTVEITLENSQNTLQNSARMPKTTQVSSTTNPQQPSSALSGIKLQSRVSTLSKSSKERPAAPLKKAPGGDEELEYPLSAAEAQVHFKECLNDFENQEIKAYDKKIYYLGQNCKGKIKGHVIKYVTNLQL